MIPVLDGKMTWAKLEKFASEFNKLEPGLAEAVLAKIGGDQSDEHYQGMVVGLAAAYQVLTADWSQGAKEIFVGGMIAAVSDILCRRR